MPSFLSVLKGNSSCFQNNRIVFAFLHHCRKCTFPRWGVSYPTVGCSLIVKDLTLFLYNLPLPHTYSTCIALQYIIIS